MKTIKTMLLTKESIVVLVLGLLITFSNPLFSQDTIKKQNRKEKIKLLVQVDKDGKTQVIDTTFSASSGLDLPGLKKIMKDYNINIRKMKDDLNKMAIEIEMNNLDSSKVDSLCKLPGKVKIIRGDLAECRKHCKSNGFQYDYDFELPPIPELPQSIPDEDFRSQYNDSEPWVKKYEEKETTLSDIIGDIPMDLVKSYSVKETKDGKKIIIELRNDPVIRHHEKVVIIKDPGRTIHSEGHGNHYLKRRIIIHPDEDDPSL